MRFKRHDIIHHHQINVVTMFQYILVVYDTVKIEARDHLEHSEF